MQEYFVPSLAFTPGKILTKRACLAISCSILYFFVCYESHYNTGCGIQNAGENVTLINSRNGSSAG